MCSHTAYYTATNQDENQNEKASFRPSRQMLQKYSVPRLSKDIERSKRIDRVTLPIVITQHRLPTGTIKAVSVARLGTKLKRVKIISFIWGCLEFHYQPHTQSSCLKTGEGRKIGEKKPCLLFFMATSKATWEKVGLCAMTLSRALTSQNSIYELPDRQGWVYNCKAKSVQEPHQPS